MVEWLIKRVNKIINTTLVFFICYNHDSYPDRTDKKVIGYYLWNNLYSWSLESFTRLSL